MTAARTLLQVLEQADAALAVGSSTSADTWATGFQPLDEVLGGGLRGGELTLLGGAQGLGKTTFALQVARNVARGGASCVYVCYEHREQDVLERLLAMELGLQGGPEALSLSAVRALCGRGDGDAGGLVERLGRRVAGVEALEALDGYAARFEVVTVGGARTSLDDIRDLVSPREDRPLVVVDYLQKVRTEGAGTDEDERTTEVVEGLKDLALAADLPVLAVVASDKSGVHGGRTRLRDLRGSTALAYEADVALLLNDKFGVVARHHLMYGSANAEEYRQWAVCSVEKNRSGRDGVDMEFRKHFAHGHFDPAGRRVAEQLLDDRVHVA